MEDHILYRDALLKIMPEKIKKLTPTIEGEEDERWYNDMGKDLTFDLYREIHKLLWDPKPESISFVVGDSWRPPNPKEETAFAIIQAMCFLNTLYGIITREEADQLPGIFKHLREEYPLMYKMGTLWAWG